MIFVSTKECGAAWENDITSSLRTESYPGSNLSIIAVNLTCLLNLLPLFWKYLSAYTLVYTLSVNTLVSRILMKKIFTHAAANFFFFLINLIEFLNKIYTYRTTLTALFFVEKQRDLPFIIQREKMSIHTNIFTVNLNSKFYWPVFKIQPLIWT